MQPAQTNLQGRELLLKCISSTCEEAFEKWTLTLRRLCHLVQHVLGFPGGSVSKESACKAGDPGSISGLGRSPGEGNGNPFQYSCLENPMDGGTWQATIHRFAKSQTWLRDFTFFHVNFSRYKQLLEPELCITYNYHQEMKKAVALKF